VDFGVKSGEGMKNGEFDSLPLIPGTRCNVRPARFEFLVYRFDLPDFHFPFLETHPLISFRNASALLVRVFPSSKMQLAAAVSAGALLCVSGTATAKHMRVHSGSRSHGLSRGLPHAIPAAFLNVPLLEPGVVPEADSEIPTEGKKYSLRLAAMHTGESINIVYRVGDTYIPTALEQLNRFLRDHRTDEVTNYDPKEFDLLYNLMTRLGKSSSGVVDIVCGYRSAETNALLREAGPSTGVAEHSQHIQGHAIDIRVPGVGTAQLRNAALSLDAGGVGYYPKSQFVHVDVGPVRTWTFGATEVRHRRKGRGRAIKHRRG
jgi:uncharacterized protein YcbK (DUF882 family)